MLHISGPSEVLPIVLPFAQFYPITQGKTGQNCPEVLPTNSDHKVMKNVRGHMQTRDNSQH